MSAPDDKPPRKARRSPAARKLVVAWKAQQHEVCEGRYAKSVYDLPLAALLLTGLTYGEDEGPALDVLNAVVSTVYGWISSGDPDDAQLHLSKEDVLHLARRIDVARELVRRGAGSFARDLPPADAPGDAS